MPFLQPGISGIRKEYGKESLNKMSPEIGWLTMYSGGKPHFGRGFIWQATAIGTLGSVSGRFRDGCQITSWIVTRQPVTKSKL